LLVGFAPFREPTHKATYERIRNCDVHWRDPTVARATRRVGPLLRRIFIPYPEQIPDMVDVIADPWFQQ
jgi:hypothetical protein